MKNTTPVVITRKDKRLKYGLHLLAAALTGGASVPISAAKAASNAGYNARTRKLQAEAAVPPADVSPAGHGEMLTGAAEKAARKAIAKGIPRERLSLAAQLAYDRLGQVSNRSASDADTGG